MALPRRQQKLSSGDAGYFFSRRHFPKGGES